MPQILEAAAAAGAAATHALVIGVSHYAHIDGGTVPTSNGAALGLDQLTCAARSALNVAEWLQRSYRNRDAPLGSLHVLLSPQPGESVPDVLRAPPWRATRANVERDLREFVKLCAQSRSNVGFVYIAGHGVQLTKDDAIVLLEDVGSPEHLNLLDGAIDAAGCRAGMDHPGTASRQFWFVDACRQVPAVAWKFETMAGALSLGRPVGRCETSPLFLAASTRESAFARPGQSTLFSEALLQALRGGAAVGPSASCPMWHVPMARLYEVLSASVRRASHEIGEEQTVDLAGRPSGGIVQQLAETPTVRFRLDVLPERARSVSQVALLRDAQEPVPGLNRGWPIVADLKAGLYLLRVVSEPPFRNKDGILDVAPPEFAHDVEMA